MKPSGSATVLYFDSRCNRDVAHFWAFAALSYEEVLEKYKNLQESYDAVSASEKSTSMQ